MPDPPVTQSIACVDRCCLLYILIIINEWYRLIYIIRLAKLVSHVDRMEKWQVQSNCHGHMLIRSCGVLHDMLLFSSLTSFHCQIFDIFCCIRPSCRLLMNLQVNWKWVYMMSIIQIPRCFVGIYLNRFLALC